jgi:hypothetical protein
MHDYLSSDLRAAEAEIDSYFKRNLLLRSRFGSAVWYLSAVFEDIIFFHVNSQVRPTIHESFVFTDNLIFALQYPFRWIWEGCLPGGNAPNTIDEKLFLAGGELLKLAECYMAFENAYTLASRGLVDLELDGRRIHLAKPYYENSRYDAYDLLLKSSFRLPDFSEGNIFDLVERHLTVSRDRFRCQLGRRLIHRAQSILAPLIDTRFQLPDDWDFGNYIWADFRRVSSVLITLGYIHLVARFLAARRGCEAVCLLSSIILIPPRRLSNLIVRNSAVLPRAVDSLLSELTFGNQNVQRLDPVLQPLIPLREDLYAVMPNLVSSTSIERNFTVLINRLPSKRNIYSRLVNKKERLMRSRIQSQLGSRGLRFYSGRYRSDTTLPDLDLVVISDSDKKVLLIELKWFIEPAEVREVIEKSEEIRRGIEQLLIIKKAFSQNPNGLHELLDIDASYEVQYAVVSDNSIGTEQVQHPEIPVVQLGHLIRYFTATKRMSEVITWLSERKYLPIENQHYEVVSLTETIGDWTLDWTGINPLTKDEFL